MSAEKQALIDIFEREYEAWERLLGSLSPAQITNPLLPDELSIKDTMAHLRAWQQRTIARLEAVLYDREPHFPPWPVASDEEESLEAVDRANAWILATNRDRPWADIHREWQAGFRRFLELLRAIPESELRPGGKLAWMLEDLSDHHHAEHRGPLEAWLRDHTDLADSD